MADSGWLDVHTATAWLVVAANGAAGIWALSAHWLAGLRRRELWWFVGLAQVMLFAQVSLGVAAVATSDIEAPEFHMFYGFVALMAVGIVYSYRHQLAAHRFLLYGGGSLFIAGLATRAIFLGPGATF